MMFFRIVCFSKYLRRPPRYLIHLGTLNQFLRFDIEMLYIQGYICNIGVILFDFNNELVNRRLNFILKFNC